MNLIFTKKTYKVEHIINCKSIKFVNLKLCFKIFKLLL